MIIAFKQYILNTILEGGYTNMFKEWNEFQEGKWCEEINVRDFIQRNYTPYEGDGSFLAAPTEATTKLWDQVLELMDKEIEKGILDTDTKVISTIVSHDAGYINKDLEQIVGLQTEKPLKRAIMPFGGLRVVENSLESYGYELDPETRNIFNYRKTHNDGVFDVYTKDMRAVRHSGIITGLPDAYGRGRIIGDYRRVALYGVDRLIEDKEKQLDLLDVDCMLEDVIRDREEIQEQIYALEELKEMGKI